MLRLRLSKQTPLLCYNFGIKSFFSNILSRSLKYIRQQPEEVQQFSLRNVDPNQPSIFKTTTQAAKDIQATQSEVNYLQKQRLINIDKALGTRTYFYEAKSYEMKLDSEHVMMIKRMKAQHLMDVMRTPVKYNSKVNQDLKLRNKKQYWKSLAKIRQYPQHKSVEFGDQSSVSFIEFMAKEVLFTRMSFHSIQDLKGYFLKEDIEMKTYLLYSSKYVYYNIPNTPLLGRTLKSKFPAQTKIETVQQSDIQVVMSLDQIYNTLLKHDNNPFVEEFLKGVENGTLRGTITESIKWTESENYLAVLIDLTGEGKEYAVVVKNLMSGLVEKVILDTAGFLGVMKDKVFFIRRDNLQVLTELCYYNIQTQQTRLVYKEIDHLSLKFDIDINGQYLYLYRTQPSNQWNQLIHVLGFQNKDHVIQIPTQPGYQYQIAFINTGFVYTKYQSNNKGIYPPTFKRVSKKLHFIPLALKGEITTREQQKRLRRIEQMKQIIKSYNEIAEKRIEVREERKEISISDQHEVIYNCEEGEGIESMLNMKNQIILNIVREWGRPEYKPSSKLHIIPRKQHTTENSLLIPDEYLTFAKAQDSYSQTIVFKLKNIVQPIFNFTTWNEELEQDRPDEIQTQLFHYQNREGISQNLSLYYQDTYHNKVMNVIMVYYDQKQQEIDFMTVRSLLKKGVMLAVFNGRGSVHGSKENFTGGIGENTINSVNDVIDAVLALHEAGRTTNVGVYCKGHHPSNVVALVNVLQPYLFTGTVIHHGDYGFKRQEQAIQRRKQKPVGQEDKIHQKLEFKIPLIPFSGSKKIQNAIEIDDLSNILISSLTNTPQNQQSRRLIHHLRKSPKKYDEIFYKEHESNRGADLTNICFLYRLIVDNSEEYSKVRDDFT